VKVNHQIVTLQIIPYDPTIENREIGEGNQEIEDVRNSILPELWDEHQIIVRSLFSGNSQTCNYTGGLEFEVESIGWAELLEDGDRDVLIGIIKQHMQIHPSNQGYHIMTLWEWGTDEHYDDEPSVWWRCLGKIDDNLLPLALDSSYQLNVLSGATHQQPIAISGGTNLCVPIEDITDSDIHRRVRYLPGHANGNPDHPDCEDGIVTSFNQHSVFVRFKSKSNPNEYQIQPQGCDRSDLIWLP
jgi:hypothetical protein